MFPFNVINWVKLVLLSGLMSILMGGVFLGIRWRYWDNAWQKDPIFEQVCVIAVYSAEVLLPLHC